MQTLVRQSNDYLKLRSSITERKSKRADMGKIADSATICFLSGHQSGSDY